MSRLNRLSGGVLGPAAAVALAACGAPEVVQDGVRDSATSFTALVGAGRHAPACDLLALTTRAELESDADTACPDALRSLRLPPAGPVHRVDVYGRQARVELRGDTMFLAQAGTGMGGHGGRLPAAR